MAPFSLATGQNHNQLKPLNSFRVGLLATIAEIEASGRWPGPVVSEINPEESFWEAEPEHQKYLLRQPGGYSCHFARPTWRLDRANR